MRKWQKEKLDPNLARSFLCFTRTSSQEFFLEKRQDSRLVAKRVVLGGLSKISLNGVTGVVKGVNIWSKTLAVALDDFGPTIHVPSQNVFIEFTVDDSIADTGGELDCDGAEFYVKSTENKSNRGVSSHFTVPQSFSRPRINPECTLHRGHHATASPHGRQKDEIDILALAEAAEDGDAHSQVELGKFYLEGIVQDPNEAARLFLMAADQGDAAGQCSLGALYVVGHGVKQNDGKALRLFNLALKQGYAAAREPLEALHYKHGAHAGGADDAGGADVKKKEISL